MVAGHRYGRAVGVPVGSPNIVATMQPQSNPGVGQPTTVGKYRLLAPIGHGGMADVYLALARGPAGFNKLLVVKQLRQAFVHDPEFLAMFMDEARLAARLNHPNVVQTYEVGHDGDIYFIAMEFLDGQPLHRVLQRFNRRGGLPMAVHLRILAEMLGGLDHAHELKDFDGTPLHVVHRDVTPQNVFVTYDGQVKLVDFGIAKAMDSVAETRVGMFKGKLAYMSPEQARGERVDRRSDVFSAGIMLWEALAGQRMWKGLGEVEVARKLADGAIPDLTEVRDDLPDELIDIVATATSTDREERYETASEFAHELERYLAGVEDRSDNRFVGKTVSGAFEEERDRMRQTIDTQVRPLLDGQDAIADTYAEISKLHSRGASEVSEVEQYRAGPDEITARYDAERRNRGWMLVGGAVLALGVAGGLGYYAIGGQTGPDEATAATRDDESDGGKPQGAKAAAPLADPSDPCSSPQKPLVELTGDIEDSATLTCDKDYLLTHQAFIKPGTTLKIEAGTTIRGDVETKGTMVVQPGGRIEAVGTADKPIVFTSEAEPGARKPGDWGGLIILGQAPINMRDAAGNFIQGEVEGITHSGSYGGSIPEDDSGRLSYVRIEYSGTKIAPNNEINGLTLAGVGRKTVIDHVMVRNTADDCFEFFGGTVDAKYLVCQNPGDDGFDYDYGYTGRLQFLLMRDDPENPDKSNGFEGDNDPAGSANAPISSPQVFNATLCGSNRKSLAVNYGMLVRKGATLNLANAIVTGFDAGVDLRDAGSELAVRSTVFFGNVSQNIAYPESPAVKSDTGKDDDNGYDEIATINASLAKNSADDPKLPDCFDVDAPKYKPETAVTANAAAPPSDGFFEASAVYVGAFRDQNDTWDSGAWVAWKD